MEDRPYSTKAIEILDAAERHMRSGGYDAVSFRDLAAEVGIKSASVHYHFPQKADLGEAVVRRYAKSVLTGLGAPDAPEETAASRIERLCGIYENALKGDGLACLCCVLGAEALDLPEPVVGAVREFFEAMLSWTEKALETENRRQATQIVAGLQGAMILALTTARPERFSDVTEAILTSLRADRPDRGR